MAYYTKVLQPDETVKVIGRLHWSIYGRAVLVLAVAVALLVLSARLTDPDWQGYALMAAGVGSTILLHDRTGSGFEPLEGVGSPLSIRNAIVAS